MKKKLLVLIFSAFMAILLCGCSDVSYTFMTKYDGSIVEEYCFAVNYAELGTGRVAVETEINEKLTVLKTNYTNDFVNKVETSTLTQEEKNSYIEGYNCYAEKAEETQNVFTYYFGFEFANRAIYEFAWGIEEDEEESEEDNGLIFEYNFLTYNIIQKTKTKFGAPVVIDQNTTVPLGKYLWDFAYEIVKTKCGEEVANALDKPTFVYNYVTTNSRLHSNADNYYSQNGIYYIHSFEVDYDTVEREIYFYQTEARREIWYAIILGVSIITVSLIFIIDKIKEKNKIKNIENNDNLKINQ